MSFIYRITNKQARQAYKTIKQISGKRPNITESNLPVYKFLLSKNNDDLKKNVVDIVEGIEKRPDTSYSISGILNKGLVHIVTIIPQKYIDPMKAVKEVFAIADKNPKGLNLVEKIVDSAQFHPRKFKEVIAEGILPAIEKATPENSETLGKIIDTMDVSKFTSEQLKGFLAHNVNLD